MAGEILNRFGLSWESVVRLSRKAQEAEAIIGIHGVSVTARDVEIACSSADRQIIENYFRVHETPSMRDPLHRTVELPKPVTEEVASLFNRLFGREVGK